MNGFPRLAFGLVPVLLPTAIHSGASWGQTVPETDAGDPVALEHTMSLTVDSVLFDQDVTFDAAESEFHYFFYADGFIYSDGSYGDGGAGVYAPGNPQLSTFEVQGAYLAADFTAGLVADFDSWDSGERSTRFAFEDGQFVLVGALGSDVGVFMGTAQLTRDEVGYADSRHAGVPVGTYVAIVAEAALDDGAVFNPQMFSATFGLNITGHVDTSRAAPADFINDCNSNGIIDGADIAAAISIDCQPNDLPDECDIALGTSGDCDSDGVPDECEPDCNTNGHPDDCDLAQGTSVDCNTNGVPDECDVRLATITQFWDSFNDPELDPQNWAAVNGATVSSSYYASSPYSLDIDSVDTAQTVPISLTSTASAQLSYYLRAVSTESGDDLQVDYWGSMGWETVTVHLGASGPVQWQLFTFDLPATALHDNFILRFTGLNSSSADDWYIDDVVLRAAASDCNTNKVPDECDVEFGGSEDCDANSIPDECQPDCNSNGVADPCDLAAMHDCCLTAHGPGCSSSEIEQCVCALDPYCCSTEWDRICAALVEAEECGSCNVTTDCNGNQIPDECEPDCNSNGVADQCDIDFGTSQDCQPDGIPDDCQADFDEDGVPDDCDTDIDGDGVANGIDVCELTPTGIPVSPQGRPLGDLDDDCDVDLDDWYYFSICISLSGPGEWPGFQDCVDVFDFDLDADVDLGDFAAFQAIFPVHSPAAATGPAR